MNVTRLVAAIAAAYVILIVAGYVVHQVWLAPVYEAMRQDYFSFRPPDIVRHKIWVVWVGDLIYCTLFAWIYTRGVEAKPWIGQGIRYGLLMAFFTAIPAALNDYVAYMIPYTLAIKWMIAGFITLPLMGLAVAGIYQPAKREA
jgi:hypothetical protein